MGAYEESILEGKAGPQGSLQKLETRRKDREGYVRPGKSNGQRVEPYSA